MTPTHRIDHYSDYNEVYPATPAHRSRRSYCDHCMTDEYRATTYLMDDGTQVGHDCLGAVYGEDAEGIRAWGDRHVPHKIHILVSHVLTPEQVSWALADPRTPYDLLTCLAHYHFPLRFKSLVESVIPAYEEWAKTPRSDYIGTVGERRELTLTCDRMYGPFQTQYGESCRWQFTSAADPKDKVSWFSGVDISSWWSVGKTVVVKGTVKSHTLHGGEKRTELTRVKFVSEAG